MQWGNIIVLRMRVTLNTFPERFKIMDSEPEKRMELRRMLVDNYSVFYTIRDEMVIVTDVLYTASDIEARVYFNLQGEYCDKNI